VRHPPCLRVRALPGHHGPTGHVAQARLARPRAVAFGVFALLWCVIVTGSAEPVQDPDEIERCRGLLQSWLPGPREHLVRILPDMVTGLEFVDPEDAE